MPPKILILDVETFPNTAYVWRFFKENIGAKQVIIIGSGPNHIGQGIEFDYCCVHASYALQDCGI